MRNLPNILQELDPIRGKKEREGEREVQQQQQRRWSHSSKCRRSAASACIPPRYFKYHPGTVFLFFFVFFSFLSLLTCTHQPASQPGRRILMVSYDQAPLWMQRSKCVSAAWDKCMQTDRPTNLLLLLGIFHLYKRSLSDALNLKTNSQCCPVRCKTREKRVLFCSYLTSVC